MMTNKFIANKKENSYEKILLLSEQTKNLYPMKILSKKNNNVKKILLKIKLKSPIKSIGIHKLTKNKTFENHNESNFCIDNLENYKNNIGIINYKLSQPNNYYIHSNKLINNISNLNNTYNEKYRILPKINNSNLRNKSLVHTREKFDINLKKVNLGDLSKYLEEQEVNDIAENINADKSILDDKKDNKNDEKIKLKKLLLMRNTTDYKFENKFNSNTGKSHKNAKLLKRFYEQKMIKYNILIKKMEEESQLKRNVMNEYINLMKENFEKNF